MRKLLFMLVLLLTSTPIFAEDSVATITVEYKYGSIELKIPKNYDALKAQFIQLAKIHAEEIKEHSKTLDSYKQALEINKKLATINFSLIDKLKNIVDSKSFNFLPTSHFIHFNFGMTYDDKTGYYGGIGYKLILLNKWIIGLDVMVPLGIGLTAGFKL